MDLQTTYIFSYYLCFGYVTVINVRSTFILDKSPNFRVNFTVATLISQIRIEQPDSTVYLFYGKLYDSKTAWFFMVRAEKWAPGPYIENNAF